MIDFVTRGLEVLIVRDNKIFYSFTKDNVIEEDCYFLIDKLNSESRRLDIQELDSKEEDQFIDLQIYSKNMAKRGI